LIIVRTERWLAAAALLSGTIAWIVYLQQGLVLSHYDAKAHLVVARRVIDNLTPGWQQLGAVWLPLPHLIQVLPTQVDLLYRTGAFGSMLSIAAFAVTVWAAARLVMAMTGSPLGAATTGLILVLNPNLLYLQSTPMTELLLLALTFLVVLWMYEWLVTGSEHTLGPAKAGLNVEHVPAKLGWALFAVMWTRYEAWPIVASALAIAAYVMTRKPGFLILRLAAWPAAAALLFVVNSRITVGSWFVSGGFYERDPFYDGLVWRSLVAVWWGTHQLSGYVIETIALVTAATLTIGSFRRRDAAPSLVPVALFAAAALPFYAFYAGHPFRVRYMVPMVAACALFCGLAVGLLRRPQSRDQSISVPLRLYGLWSPALAVLLIGSSLVESPLWSRNPPMVAEAQWDAPRSHERRVVTDCLAPQYRGERVMASMGSLAHYMQELSHVGFAVADFLHEGNGVIWQLALETGPAPHAGWMLVEEQSEGGDVLAQRVRVDAAFTRGMVRVCEGGGVALYRREGTTATNHRSSETQSSN
jgi:hypothetical protein